MVGRGSMDSGAGLATPRADRHRSPPPRDGAAGGAVAGPCPVGPVRIAPSPRPVCELDAVQPCARAGLGRSGAAAADGGIHHYPQVRATAGSRHPCRATRPRWQRAADSAGSSADTWWSCAPARRPNGTTCADHRQHTAGLLADGDPCHPPQRRRTLDRRWAGSSEEAIMTSDPALPASGPRRCALERPAPAGHDPLATATGVTPSSIGDDGRRDEPTLVWDLTVRRRGQAAPPLARGFAVVGDGALGNSVRQSANQASRRHERGGGGGLARCWAQPHAAVARARVERREVVRRRHRQRRRAATEGSPRRRVR